MKKSIKIIGLIFICSYILNFIWENLHFPLYASNTVGIENSFILMLYASLIDAFWITLVYIFISIIDKEADWKLNKANVILFSILLIAIAIVIEKKALLTGRWEYSSSMPVIFGLGVSPLLQLAATGLLSLFITRKMISD